MEQLEVVEPSEPFLLFESSQAFLDGDPRGIRARFQFRRDVLDYIAMAFVAVGALLLMVKVMQLMRGILWGGGGVTWERLLYAAVAAAVVLAAGQALFERMEGELAVVL